MTGMSARDWIDAVTVDPEITRLWPGYVVHLVAVDEIDPGLLAPLAARLLAEAEESVTGLDPEAPGAHIVAWREVFRSFGVAPRVARSSVDALTRRGAKGLPRIGALVDLYNAVSVLHRVPIGGEDLGLYSGAARLVVADGSETCLTTADGEPVVQNPEPGEPIWVDDGGVTCRRWNWRQTTRTAISDSTRAVGFIIDSLDGPDHASAASAADALAAALPGALRRVVAP